MKFALSIETFVATVLVVALASADGFSFVSTFRRDRHHCSNNKRTNIKSRSAATGTTMFLDGVKDFGYKSPIKPKADTSRLGNLIVPNVGIGTISWSSTSRK